MADEANAVDGDGVPVNYRMAFAYFVSRCGEGYGNELIREGKTPTQARNAIIHDLLAFASGEACRLARSEGREPDVTKWRIATERAFERAVIRTAKAATPAVDVDSVTGCADDQTFGDMEPDALRAAARKLLSTPEA